MDRSPSSSSSPSPPSLCPRQRALGADVLLLLAAVIWGSGFSAQRAAAEHLSPITFNAARYLVAAFALTPIALRWGRARPPRGWQTPGILGAGIAAGAILFVASWFQQAGIEDTTAANAGFITGLYVILVPLLGWAAGVRPPWSSWPAALLAAAGLYCLSVPGTWQLGRGDLLVLVSAVFWAIHVLLVGRLVLHINGVTLAWLQMAVAALLSLPFAWATDGLPWAGLQAAALPIAYNGIACGAIAFTFQILGQRQAPPAHAAILLSLEAVFAAVFGWILLGEQLSSRAIAGCVLMFVGMSFSQAPLLAALWHRTSRNPTSRSP